MSLIDAARKVRENAHAPYSRFKVGAAVRAASGKVYVGCNVENVAYPEGTCAEAGAICGDGGCRRDQADRGRGHRRLPAPGAALRRLPPETGRIRRGLTVSVTLATTDGAVEQTTIGALLPGGFSTEDMARA